MLPNPFICEGAEVLLTATSGNSYQWLDMEGNLLSEEVEYSVSPTVNTNYQLVVSNELCSDSTSLTIEGRAYL